MRLRALILAAGLAVFGLPALAADDARPSDPVQQALVQMLQEAQSREANALMQVHALRAQAATEKARADTEKARADAAEARLTRLMGIQVPEPAKP